MRPHEKIAEFFGYDVFRMKRSHITLRRHLCTLFDFLGVNLVIDVGANEGQYGTMLRKAGYRGRIVSFEPVSSTFERLRSKTEKDTAWWSRKCALSAEIGRKHINVTKYSDLASFYKPNAFAEKSFSGNIEISSEENVDVTTLDHVFGEICDGINEPRVFLKMDTQGHDLEVLAGAVKSLDKILGIQSEVAVIPIYEGIPDYVESLSKFRGLGYESTGLYPVSRDGASMVVIEYDCVMVKCSSKRS